MGSLCNIYGLYINTKEKAKLNNEHFLGQTKGYLHPMLETVDLKLPSPSCLVLLPFLSPYIGYNT